MPVTDFDWNAISALCSLATTVVALFSIRTARAAQREASRVIEITKEATLQIIETVGQRYGEKMGDAASRAMAGVRQEVERLAARDHSRALEEMQSRLRKLEGDESTARRISD